MNICNVSYERCVMFVLHPVNWLPTFYFRLKLTRKTTASYKLNSNKRAGTVLHINLGKTQVQQLLPDR